jgi:hypothetical protein
MAKVAPIDEMGVLRKSRSSEHYPSSISVPEPPSINPFINLSPRPTWLTVSALRHVLSMMSPLPARRSTSSTPSLASP